MHFVMTTTEGFNGGSHKQLISTLEGLLTEKGETVCVVSLPATKWHWRTRTGALALAALIPKSTCANGGFRVLFTSAVFSLPELLALRPDLASIPHKYLYFHENQLAYPLRDSDEGATKSDYQFAYIQVLSALAADLVLFNSAFNMHSFYERLPAFLAAGLPTPPSPRVPEPRGLVEKLLKPKSRVLHFLVEPPPLPVLVHGDLDDFEAAVCSQAERIRARGRAPLRILWNHRWDYDKNPADFFKVIFDLANISVDEEFSNLGRSTLRPSTGDVIAPSEMSPPSLSSEQAQPRFQISVIGGSGQDVPRIFPIAESYLRPTGHISVWGFVGPREAYWRTLADCDVVVSTAKHEFFGVAVVEAVAVGCVPLLPHRLAYPELLAHGPSPSMCLYRTLSQMRKQLKYWIGAPDRLRERAAKALLDAYDRKGTGTGAWLRKGPLAMELLGGSFVPQRTDFSPPISTIQQANVTSIQSFPAQANSPIVQMDNPNPFSNVVLKQEESSQSLNALFTSDFTQQQQPSSSSSTATSNDAPVQKGHTCDVCHKAFADRSLLSKHKIAHAEAKHVCNTCGRAFVREDKLRRHFRSVHSNERPFICEVCSKAFARKDKLQEHAKHHNKDITFPCTVCSEVFLMRSLLNRHLRTEHQIKQTTESSRNSARSHDCKLSSLCGKKRARAQQEADFAKLAMENATAGITAAAAASAVAPAASGFYQHPSWNPANFLFCNRYQHSQQPVAQPAFDFWGGNNGYLYGQQYAAAGYQFPSIQYAAAMRQQQQQTSQQTAAPSSLSYNSAAAAALTARLLSPGNYFWPQPSQSFVLPQAGAASMNPAASTNPLIPATNPYFSANLTAAAVATTAAAPVTTDVTAATSKTVTTEAAPSSVQPQMIFDVVPGGYSVQSATSTGTSSYQTAYYQAESLAGSEQAVSAPAPPRRQQQQATDSGTTPTFAYTN
ncbi:Glycosyltransferase-like domain-containing protein 1 [Taenia solium]